MWMRASTLGHPHRWPTPENANRTHPAAEATAFREGGPRPGCVKTHPNRKLQRSALREQHCGHTRHAASTLPSAMFLSRHQFWIGDGSFSHRPGWRWADAANGHPYLPNAFNKPRSRPPASQAKPGHAHTTCDAQMDHIAAHTRMESVMDSERNADPAKS